MKRRFNDSRLGMSKDEKISDQELLRKLDEFKYEQAKELEHEENIKVFIRFPKFGNKEMYDDMTAQDLKESWVGEPSVVIKDFDKGKEYEIPAHEVVEHYGYQNFKQMMDKDTLFKEEKDIKPDHELERDDQLEENEDHYVDRYSTEELVKSINNRDGNFSAVSAEVDDAILGKVQDADEHTADVFSGTLVVGEGDLGPQAAEWDNDIWSEIDREENAGEIEREEYEEAYDRNTVHYGLSEDDMKYYREGAERSLFDDEDY